MRIHPLSAEGKTTSKAKLEALRLADDIRRDTSQAKNDLESYILKVTAVLAVLLLVFVFCRLPTTNQWRFSSRVERKGRAVQPRTP